MSYLLVWDLDGCLYHFETNPVADLYALCDEAKALAAKDVFPEMPQKRAIALGKESYAKYGDSVSAFLACEECEDRDKKAIRQDLFIRSHDYMFELITERHPTYFDHVAPTVEAFAKLPNGLFSHAILSHASMSHWGIKILKRTGLLAFFEPHLLLGMDDYGFERKSESVRPMQKMIEKSGFVPENIIFIEDTLKNTQPPAKAFGIRSALIYATPQPPPSLPGHVRWTSNDPAQLLETLAKDLLPRPNPQPKQGTNRALVCGS